MKSSDVFPVLLNALDDVGRVFDHDDTSRWPPGELEALEQFGLVRQATGGLHAPCPNCYEAHVEPVTIRQATDGALRYFIRCPESMRVEVTAEMCIGWQVDGDGLAKAISAAMDLKSMPKAMVPGRLWRLGRTPWKQATREVVLATRLNDTDATSITAHLGPGGRAIVFVPREAPDARICPAMCRRLSHCRGSRHSRRRASNWMWRRSARSSATPTPWPRRDRCCPLILR